MLKIKHGFKIFVKRKDSRLIFFISSLIIFIGFFFLENWNSASQVFSFDVLPLTKRIFLFLSTLFNTTPIDSLNVLFLVIATAVSGALVISLLYTYVKIRERILLRHGVYGGFGMVFALLGLGCAACGTILLQTILSLFGFGGLLTMFPYHGVELGYIGLVFLIFNAYTLCHKLGSPLTC